MHETMPTTITTDTPCSPMPSLPADILRRVLPFVPKDGSRPVLTAHGCAWATDGHRLVKATLPEDFSPAAEVWARNGSPYVGPDVAKKIGAIDGYLDVWTIENGRKDGTRAVVRAKDLVGQVKDQVAANKPALDKARADYKAMSPKYRKRNPRPMPEIGLVISEGTVRVCPRSEPRAVLVNPGYLLDALKACDGHVAIELAGELDPILLVSETVSCLVMPVRR